MPIFKIEALEAYSVQVGEIEADTLDEAKLKFADLTDDALFEAVAPVGGTASLAWRQFKAVVPVEARGGHAKGKPHKSKQKGEK